MIRGISSEVPPPHDRKRKDKSYLPYPAQQRKPDLPPATTHPACRMRTWPTANTASYRFHFSNFRYYFTLFSKFFSSFPHGTCSLSVSHQYLALDGIYHPLRAAIPNNSTRWRSIVHPDKQAWTGLSPSTAADSTALCSPILDWFDLYRLQLRRFSVWAFPASLAVTDGILVSFFSSA